MSRLDELRQELKNAANQGEEAFQRALDALGPDDAQHRRFAEWLADPENQKRWDTALHKVSDKEEEETNG